MYTIQLILMSSRSHSDTTTVVDFQELIVEEKDRKRPPVTFLKNVIFYNVQNFFKIFFFFRHQEPSTSGLK